MKIYLMIDSASRPDLLEKTVSSIIKHVKFSGDIVWCYHEAVLRKDDSEKCINYIKNLNMFDIIKVDDPPKGQGTSIDSILSIVDSGYFIHWEDDMEAIRDINLDISYNIMKNNNGVNQITFNRRDTLPDSGGIIKKVVEVFGQKLTTCPHWRYTPALWKCSFILPYWRKLKPEHFRGNNSHWEINIILQGKLIKEGKNADWVMNNMGTYYLGGIDEKAYVRHLGSGRSGRI